MAVELNLDNIKWPKDFPELKALDDLLRCRICYGYIKTCMITSCSHNYCSLCIRKSIHYKTQCPTCFEEIYEPHLRNNRAFDQFVELFSGIRDKLLRHLRIADTQLSQQSDDPSIPRCIKFEQYSPIPNGDIFKKNKGESSRLKHGSGALDLPKAVIDRPSVSRRLDNEIVSPPLHNEALPTIPKMFLSPKKQVDTVKPKQNIGIPTVPCPVCEVDIPERNINLHLDSCLVRSEKPVTKSPEKKKKRSPLSKMVYSMMSEKDLRKRLKDHGLNSHGDKKTLINRIQRFTVLYNSECDSDNPRPIADIIRQIDKEDNGEKKNVGTLLAQPRLPAVNRKTDPKIIEEENKKYIEENKSSFNALINAVRLREGRHAPPLKRRFEKIVSSSSDDDEPDIIEIPLENKSTEIELLELETSVNIHDGDRTLFDSSDNELSEEYPMSPVLKRTTTPLRNNCLTSNGNLSTKKDCSSVTCLPQVNKGKENKNLTSKIKLLSKSPTDKTVTGICGTQVINYDSDTSAPSPSCIEPEDDDNRSSLSVDSDTEENNELNQDLDKATANFEEIKRKGSKINHSVLEKEYELSEEFSMSPVLKSTITPSKNNNLMAKENISSKKDLSSSQIIKGKENKNLIPKIKLLSKSTNKTVSGNCETQVLCYDSDTSAPSPSCIVPEAEDDDNLSSLSADDDLEDDVLNFTNQDLDQATENYRLKDSQIDDPDFKIQDEDLDLEESEEFFVPTRRSKRKLTTPPPTIKCNTPISQSKRKAKTPISSGTKSPVSRSLRKRAKH